MGTDGERTRSPRMRAAARNLATRGLGRHRGFVQAGADGLAWASALLFATVLRFDFSAGYEELSGLFTLIPAAIIVHALAGLAFGTYTGRSRFGSFDEVTRSSRPP